MDPFTIGAGALGALETVNGGSAGPSNALGGTNAGSDMNFNHGAVNFGSNNGVPDWVLIGALLIGGWYVYKKVK